MSQSRLTNRQRLEICRHKSLNPILKNKDLVPWVRQQYGLTVSTVTVGNILKRKPELEEMTPSNIDAKKPRVSRHPLLEEALVFWILQCQARNVAVTGNLIKAKAQKFREQLEIGGTVEFSNGWQQNFQQRNQLKCIRSHGESGSANTAGMEHALPILKNLIKNYQPRDIYNMDETGLFYNLSPDKTIAQKQIEGLKKDKTRITLCLASNADGSDKLEPMIIGHFKKPRCFQSKSGNQLGFYYRSNKKAWMTRELFQEWLLKFNEKIKKEKRHVLLLLDNAPSHISNGLEIANVKIHFLPPNTTSQIQPMDAGIISAFKRHYRNLHLQGALDKVDQGLDNFYKFDQLTAMKWSLVAWKEISTQTISNCFTHTGLFEESIPSHTSHTLEADEQSIELGLHEVFTRLAVRNAMSIANFLNPIEEDQGAIEELDDSQIIEMVQLQEEEEEDEEEEEEEELAEKIPQFSRAEKLKSLGMVISLLDISKEKELEAYRLLKRIQDKTRYSSGTQNTLDRWLI